MSTEHVRIEREDRVLRILLNRPEKKNALTTAMYDSITDALAQAERDATVRVVILTGAPDCFTSGNDLKDFLQNPPQGEESPVARFLATISQVNKPLVAAVNGPAVGVGTTMLLHCDLVYAGMRARFQLPFVALGLCPEAASSLLLPLLVGHQRAAELLLLGEPFDGQRALALGLVNAVLPDNEYQQFALTKAHQLAGQPPSALRTTKALLKRTHRTAVAEALRLEGADFTRMLREPEAQEAMTAFMQKRKPDFSRFN